MDHHFAVVVWRVPGNPHPLAHVGEADSPLAVVADAHRWAARAQLANYTVSYAGCVMDADPIMDPGARYQPDELIFRRSMPYGRGDMAPYVTGPTAADRLHERLIERGDDDDDRGPYGPDDPYYFGHDSTPE